MAIDCVVTGEHISVVVEWCAFDVRGMFVENEVIKIVDTICLAASSYLYNAVLPSLYVVIAL